MSARRPALDGQGAEDGLGPDRIDVLIRLLEPPRDRRLARPEVRRRPARPAPARRP
ncbi:MAG: hypothetical protein U0800_01075 [Isosphaeraceae bacterium]